MYLVCKVFVCMFVCEKRRIPVFLWPEMSCACVHKLRVHGWLALSSLYVFIFTCVHFSVCICMHVCILLMYSWPYYMSLFCAFYYFSALKQLRNSQSSERNSRRFICPSRSCISVLVCSSVRLKALCSFIPPSYNAALWDQSSVGLSDVGDFDTEA